MTTTPRAARLAACTAASALALALGACGGAPAATQPPDHDTFHDPY